MKHIKERVLESLYSEPKKVELSAEAVELALMDDLFKYNKRANDFKDEAFRMLEATEIAFKNVVHTYGLAMDTAEKAAAAAKELGVPLQPFIKKIDSAKSNMKTFSKYTKLK